MRVAVIGSGPSGVAATSVLLRRQFSVDIFDGGESPEPFARSTANTIASNLREGITPSDEHLDMLRFGPGNHNQLHLIYNALSAALFKSIHPRQLEKRIFGSNFAFRGTDTGIPLDEIWLPRSLATGGLSNVWGAACYPLRKDDYFDWPINESDLAPWYSQAEALARVDAEVDFLSDVYPLYGQPAHIHEDLRFDPLSPVENLLKTWSDNHAALAQHGFTGGRSRLAVLPPDNDGQGCLRCGLCLYGCPVDAIWHSDKVLNEFAANPGFLHRPGSFVRRLKRDSQGLWLFCGSHGTEETCHGPYDSVFLAAGPLSSLRIAIDTLNLDEHQCQIVENDTFIIPFRMVSPLSATDVQPVGFAMSQAVLALEPGLIGKRAAHLQFYRITEPILGNIGRMLATLPLNIGQMVFKHLRRHLLALVYLHSDDSRLINVQVSGKADGISRVRIQTHERAYQAALRRISSVFDSVQPLTGLKMLDFWSRFGPPGFSGHIGGTLPLSTSPSLLQCHSDGQLEGIPGVYVVDMSVFPAMPAQNPTLTAMANAMRCADGIARSSRTEIAP